MKKVDFDIKIGQYAEDLVDEVLEMSAAKEYKYTPVVITIKKVLIDMKDDYNGLVVISLSNGDIVTYSCDERKTRKTSDEAPPFYDVSFQINGQEILKDEEFDEVFCVGDTLVWVTRLMEMYEEYV